jgi:hypothetical protein
MGAVEVNVPELVLPAVGGVGLTGIGSLVVAPPANAELAVTVRAKSPIVAATIVFEDRIM